MSSFASRLARWRAFSPAQRQAFVQAWCLLPVVWLGLRVWALPRLHKRMATGARASTAPSSLQVTEAQAIGSAVNTAARHSPLPVTCLTRSLVLLRLLANRNVAAQLRVGVQLLSGALDAHAWVEVDGVPVNDRADIALTYAPFDGLEQSLAFRSS